MITMNVRINDKSSMFGTSHSRVFRIELAVRSIVLGEREIKVLID
jgi:hypothetical protein